MAQDGQGEETALDFLRLSENVRMLGLANAGVALASDRLAMCRNPAITGKHLHSEFGIMHNGAWEQSKYESFLFSTRPDSSWALGFSLLYFSERSIQVSTPPSFATTPQARSHDLDLGLTLSKKVDRNFSFGVTLKNIFRQSTERGHTLAFSIGTLYETDKLTFGAALINVGPALTVLEEKRSLPFGLTLGASKEIQRNVLVSGEILGRKEGGKMRLNQRLGVELSLLKVLRFRVGTEIQGVDNPSPHLAGGGGFRLKDFSFDYAYNSSQLLGKSHFFSLRFAIRNRHPNLIGQAGLPAETKSGSSVSAVKGNYDAESEDDSYIGERTPIVSSSFYKLEKLNRIIGLVQLVALKSDSLRFERNPVVKKQRRDELFNIQNDLTAEIQDSEFRYRKLVVRDEESLYELLFKVDALNRGAQWKRIYSAWNGNLDDLSELRTGQSVYVIYKKNTGEHM